MLPKKVNSLSLTSILWFYKIYLVTVWIKHVYVKLYTFKLNILALEFRIANGMFIMFET